MAKKLRFRSGMNISDHISESLGTIFCVKMLKFFYADPDPGSGTFFDPGSGLEKIRIQDSGSETLLVMLVMF
jgi:hypothetical protein